MTNQQIEKWEQVSALYGAFAWAALAWRAGNGRAPLGVIELLFLFAPLVIVPLGLALGRMVSPLKYRFLDALVRFLQPVAAGLSVASFWLAPGWLAGMFAVPWLLLCGSWH